MVPLKKNKKAAIELSIGTVVIIVLGVTMLILGVVLVTKIMNFGTSSVDSLSDKTMGEISRLFASGESDVAVKLGSDKTVKISAGSDAFGVAFGAQLPDGSNLIDRNHLSYQLFLEDPDSARSCVHINTEDTVKDWFERGEAPFDSLVSMGQVDGPTAGELIKIAIPKGTPLCSQRVAIEVRDTKQSNQLVGTDFFIFEVKKKGIFG